MPTTLFKQTAIDKLDNPHKNEFLVFSHLYIIRHTMLYITPFQTNKL